MSETPQPERQITPEYVGRTPAYILDGESEVAQMNATFGAYDDLLPVDDKDSLDPPSVHIEFDVDPEGVVAAAGGLLGENVGTVTASMNMSRDSRARNEYRLHFYNTDEAGSTMSLSYRYKVTGVQRSAFQRDVVQEEPNNEMAELYRTLVDEASILEQFDHAILSVVDSRLDSITLPQDLNTRRQELAVQGQDLQRLRDLHVTYPLSTESLLTEPVEVGDEEYSKDPTLAYFRAQQAFDTAYDGFLRDVHSTFEPQRGKDARFEGILQPVQAVLLNRGKLYDIRRQIQDLEIAAGYAIHAQESRQESSQVTEDGQPRPQPTMEFEEELARIQALLAHIAPRS